jgi:hypothetical protein
MEKIKTSVLAFEAGVSLRLLPWQFASDFDLQTLLHRLFCQQKQMACKACHLGVSHSREDEDDSPV